MRIASLQPSVTITLAALGRLDALCAHTKYCVEFLPELAARGLPILHDSWSFDKAGNIEALLAARPEVVIASVPYRMESLAAVLKAGVPVLALAPHSLKDVYADIQLIAAVGSAGDASADPEPLIAQMQGAIEETRERTRHIPQERRPLVYCEEWGRPIIHSQAWVAELVDAAGGRFFGTPGAHADAEAIAALPESAQPDVLLFAWCGAGDRVPLARVIEQRNWHTLRAVRAGRVRCIPDEYLNTPAPTLLEGLRCIAGAVHPQLFGQHPRLINLAAVDPVHPPQYTQ
jgi:iron complex transport system substrate-binding protein